MAGYHNFSKSNNAVIAERNGLYPKTQAIKEIAKKYGFSQKKVKAWIDAGGYTPSEWHHSSKFYNEIQYYNTELDEDALEDLTDFEPASSDPKKSEESGIYLIQWIEWEGTRRHPKAVKHEYEGRAVIKGDWISFDNKKKKISGKHITIEKKGEKHDI